MQGTWVQSCPGRLHMSQSSQAQEPQPLSLHAATSEAYRPSLCSTREVTTRRKPTPCTKHEPCSLQLEKAQGETQTQGSQENSSKSKTMQILRKWSVITESSLEVQWLGGLGSIPGHRAKIPQAAWYDPKKKKSNHSLRIVTWNNNQKIPMFLLCFHNYNSTITSSVLEGLLYFGAVLCGTWDLSSLRRDWTHTPCSGSTGSYPLDHQASPFCRHFSGIN